MEFLDGLLKDGGCNVDGTSSSINPVSALVNNLFETNHQQDDSLLMGQQDMAGMNMMAQAQSGGIDGGGMKVGGMAGGEESLLGSLTNMMIGNTDHNMNMQGMGPMGGQMGGMQQGMGGMMGGMGGMMQSMQMMAMAEQMQGMQGMHQQQHHQMLHEIQHLRSQMREMQEGQNDVHNKTEYRDEFNGDIPLDELGQPMMRGARENAEIYDNIHSVYGDPIDQDYGGPSKEAQAQGWEDLKERLENMGKDVEDSYVFEEHNPYLIASRSTNIHTGLNGVDNDTAREAMQQALDQGQDFEDSEVFQKGLRFFNKGYIQKAILAFEAEVQQHSGNDEAWRYLGLAHAENDEDKKAIVCLKKSLEVDPYNLNSLLALGTSYVNELDSQNALDALKSWVTHNPRFVGLEVTDDEYSDGTLMDEVMQLVLAAHSHAPEDSEVKVLLGVMYNVSTNYLEACQLFQDAVTIEESKMGMTGNVQLDNDGNAVATTPSMEYSLYNKVGASLANNNKSDEALSYYARALSHRPTYARAWLNLGISFANLNRYEESAKAYLQALHLSPTANHIWSYLKVVFTCLDQFDNVELCASGDIHTLATRLNMTFQPSTAQEEVSMNGMESQQEIESLPKSVAGVDVTFLGALTQKQLLSTPDS